MNQSKIAIHFLQKYLNSTSSFKFITNIDLASLSSSYDFPCAALNDNSACAIEAILNGEKLPKTYYMYHANFILNNIKDILHKERVWRQFFYIHWSISHCSHNVYGCFQFNLHPTLTWNFFVVLNNRPRIQRLTKEEVNFHVRVCAFQCFSSLFAFFLNKTCVASS